MLAAMHDKPVSEIASLGGKARAKRLNKDQRSEIARNAAAIRWGNDTPRATHTGELRIGNTIIPCAVLEDGTRLLTQWGFYRAIGRSGRPAGGWGSDVEKVAPFLALDNLKPYVSNELADSTKPIVFRLPSGRTAYGYRAELLPQVCEVYLQARQAGDLLKSQLKFAAACEILTRGLAHIGIIALVDEATGHQHDRARDALAKILEAFVQKELRKWVSTFPADYYRQIFRLHGWKFPDLKKDQHKRPALVGKITNDIVYSRLAPGVRAQLHRITPRDEKGRLKQKLFQRLTEDVGHPKLREHLAAVTVLMKASDNWGQFIGIANRVLPKHAEMPLFDDPSAAEGDMTPAL